MERKLDLKWTKHALAGIERAKARIAPVDPGAADKIAARIWQSAEHLR